MLKKPISFILALLMVLSFAACADDGSAVPVQRADQLLYAAAAGERYAAMVVSEDVTGVTRDYSKTIAEVYVAVGDTVMAGDKLFSYDLEALELEHEKQLLELEKMKNEQTGYSEQLPKLEQQLARTYNELDKSRLNLEINTLKTTILENEYQIKAKEKSIGDIEEMLSNVDVLSPVDGTIRSINEDQSGQYYISVQRDGAYKLKGTLNEMSMYGGMSMGARVRAYSRLDENQWWDGTVIDIAMDEPEQNQGDYWYGGAMDTMTTTSNYAFFVELDSLEGLLLGQHVYVELLTEDMGEGLWIPESFIVMEFDENSGEASSYVWAASKLGKLTKCPVTLGMYDGMKGAYEVVEGLSPEDFVADPMHPLCAEGANVSQRLVSDFSGEE